MEWQTVVWIWGFQRNGCGAVWYLDREGSVPCPSDGSHWLTVITISFYVIHFCYTKVGFVLFFTNFQIHWFWCESYENSNFSVCTELLMSINIDKLAFPKMLMLLFFKYVLPVLIFFSIFKIFSAFEGSRPWSSPCSTGAQSTIR